MSILRIKACYLKQVVDEKGNPTGDIDLHAHFPEFLEEIRKAEMFAKENGWGHLRICANAQPEGKGQYTHKLRIVE